MRKKLFLAIGAIGSVALPASAAISCGSKEKSKKVTKTQNSTTTDHNGGNSGGSTSVTPGASASASQSTGVVSENNAAQLLGKDYLETHIKKSDELNNMAEWSDSFTNYRDDTKNALANQLYNVLNAKTDTDSARAIIGRYIGNLADKDHLVLEKIKRFEISKNDPTAFNDLDPNQEDDHYFDQYKYWVDHDGKLHVQGSSPVAISHGWYEWLKANGLGMVGWEANSVNIQKYRAFLANSENQKDEPQEVRRSPYEKHYFMNSATAGYSTPWWTAEKWMDWLSWSALHGYDLMLDYVGHETIGAQMFKEMGFSDEQIRNYYTGPAFATWGRLGNLDGWDPNPHFNSWIEKQKALQHTILGVMHKLSIKPIVASFAGFVPKEIATLPGYHDTITHVTHWSSEASPSYFLDPNNKDPRDRRHPNNKDLFKNLSKKYVQLYEKEFGPQEFYLADSFEEMTVPPYNPSSGLTYQQHKVKFLSDTGAKLYEGIKEATEHHTKYTDQYKDESKRGELAILDEKEGIFKVANESNHIEKTGGATWAFQGWMLGFDRATWDSYSTLDSFLKFVPKHRTLLIDEAEDYNNMLWHGIGTNYEFFKPNPHDPNSGVSFSGAKWVYSTIPNMGGNTAITGDLAWYATSGVDALLTPKHGYLYAYGSAPEGIDNNPVTQELISDMGFKGQEIVFDNDESNDPKNDISSARVRVNEWLRNYSLNRSGLTWSTSFEDINTPSEPADNASDEDKKAAYRKLAEFHMKEYWRQRMATANSYLDDHPVYYFQYTPFTTWTAESTDAFLRALREYGYATNYLLKSINLNADADNLNINSENLLANLTEEQTKMYDDLKKSVSPLLKDDLYRMSAQYTGIVLDREIQTPASRRNKAKVDELYMKMDRILAEHNTDRLERWLEWARSWGDTEEEKNYYEQDAKRHLTLWWPDLNDYAAKTWSGLLMYYKGRLDYGMNHETSSSSGGWYADRIVDPYVKDWVDNPNPQETTKRQHAYRVNVEYIEEWVNHPNWTPSDNPLLQDSVRKNESYGPAQMVNAINFMTHDTSIGKVKGHLANHQQTVFSGYKQHIKDISTTVHLSTQQLGQLAGGKLAVYADAEAGAYTGNIRNTVAIKSIEISFGNGDTPKYTKNFPLNQPQIIGRDMYGRYSWNPVAANPNSAIMKHNELSLISFANDIWANANYLDSNNGADMVIRYWDNIIQPNGCAKPVQESSHDGSHYNGVRVNLKMYLIPGDDAKTNKNEYEEYYDGVVENIRSEWSQGPNGALRQNVIHA